MHSLPIFLKLTGRAVILVGEGAAADAKRRLLERAGAVVVPETADVQLAIVAIEDEDEAHAIVARLRARGILVNAVDRPALCDFTLPAIIDRDPVLLAIGTGGASAGLAKALRILIEGLLPQRLGSLASALAAARGAMRQRWPGADERRRAIDTALAPGGLLDPLRDHDENTLDAWLARTDAGDPQAELAILKLHSVDPDDLSLRQARLLGRADRVFHPSNMPPALLARARADAERILHDGAAPPPYGGGLSLWLRWEG